MAPYVRPNRTEFREDDSGPFGPAPSANPFLVFPCWDVDEPIDASPRSIDAARADVLEP